MTNFFLLPTDHILSSLIDTCTMGGHRWKSVSISAVFSMSPLPPSLTSRLSPQCLLRSGVPEHDAFSRRLFFRLLVPLRPHVVFCAGFLRDDFIQDLRDFCRVPYTLNKAIWRAPALLRHRLGIEFGSPLGWRRDGQDRRLIPVLPGYMDEVEIELSLRSLSPDPRRRDQDRTIESSRFLPDRQRPLSQTQKELVEIEQQFVVKGISRVFRGVPVSCHAIVMFSKNTTTD